MTRKDCLLFITNIFQMRNMASYDLRQIVSALDDMNKAVYKIQHSNEVKLDLWEPSVNTHW